jgi:predicted transcriptional regulator
LIWAESLDEPQAGLAREAEVSPSTISNVEGGRDAREETTRAIRKALRKSGITIHIDKLNGLAIAAIRFDEPEDD